MIQLRMQDKNIKTLNYILSSISSYKDFGSQQMQALLELADKSEQEVITAKNIVDESLIVKNGSIDILLCSKLLAIVSDKEHASACIEGILHTLEHSKRADFLYALQSSQRISTQEIERSLRVVLKNRQDRNIDSALKKFSLFITCSQHFSSEYNKEMLYYFINYFCNKKLQPKSAFSVHLSILSYSFNLKKNQDYKDYLCDEKELVSVLQKFFTLYAIPTNLLYSWGQKDKIIFYHKVLNQELQNIMPYANVQIWKSIASLAPECLLTKQAQNYLQNHIDSLDGYRKEKAQQVIDKINFEIQKKHLTKVIKKDQKNKSPTSGEQKKFKI